MMRELLIEMPEGAGAPIAHLLLTHGASQPMTSGFFDTLVPMLRAHKIAVTRFEFQYMREIRESGKRRPPPRINTLFPEFLEVVESLRAEIDTNEKLIVGGKSMGGRIASMMADGLAAAGKISGLTCLGYPFHPPKNPERLRTAHLTDLSCPTLIIQGNRDPFGTREEVESYQLSQSIELKWIGDGDHDFGPRVQSGFTREGNLEDAAEAIAQFAQKI